ncbi:MAG: hypothetical protein D8M59_00920 [Planctomycetes bacterium]|nr:hypothetical protein [Planctomycetota bacterium]NOG54718.1 hypothetical protein [Planctomycetota bacterium]
MRDEVNRTDILERAALDAIGLLTPEEVFDLESDLKQADPTLLDEVRQVRQGVQVFRETLPEVEPDPGLRTRVLAAVSQMIQQDLRESVQEARSQRMYLHSGNGRRDWLEPMIAGRVSPMWRVSALIAATIAIAFSWFYYQQASTITLLTQYVTEQETRELLSELERHLGNRPQNLIFSPRSEDIFFKSEDTALAGIARMWFDPEDGNGIIVAKNLPAKPDPYVLCLRPYDPTGKGGPTSIKPVAAMPSDGHTIAVSFKLSGDSANGASWCVLEPIDPNDEAVAGTANPMTEPILWITGNDADETQMPYRIVLNSVL